MDAIDKYLKESADIAAEQINLKPVFLEIAEQVFDKVKEGGTVFFCGNGGSAADSQHLAAELIGRFKKNRKPISSIALTTDTSIITSTANDFSYDEIFTQQLSGQLDKNDLFIGLSTSGNSKNIIKAIELCNKNGNNTILMTGDSDISLNSENNLTFKVPSKNTPSIQEVHIILLHSLAEEIEKALRNK